MLTLDSHCAFPSIHPLPGYDKGDEYDILLRYVSDEAEKSKHKKDEDEDGEKKFTRPWYAPWKKVEVKSDKEKTVRVFAFLHFGLILHVGSAIARRHEPHVLGCLPLRSPPSCTYAGLPQDNCAALLFLSIAALLIIFLSFN